MNRFFPFALALLCGSFVLAGCAGGGSAVRSPSSAALESLRGIADSGRALPGNSPTPLALPVACAMAGDSGRALPGDSGRALPGTPDCPSTNWQGGQGWQNWNDGGNSSPLCPTPDKAHGKCHILARNDLKVVTGNTPPSYGYRPADLWAAYGIPRNLGNGQTVAVIDARDSRTAESDLAVYRAAFGLPPCTSSNGCFKKVSIKGNFENADNSWTAEIALDLDMVSAACPNCKILLVEALDDNIANLAAAVDVAASYHPAAISNSYYAQIDPSADPQMAQHYKHPGIAMTVAAGDGGYGATFPAGLNTVIAVGATTLWAGAHEWQEKAWGLTDSGCSPISSKPAWQTDTGCATRTMNDVAIVGDPLTGVLIYDTSTSGFVGWSTIGGTSVGAPLIAALYAGSGGAGTANGAATLYAKGPAAFYDITVGTDGNCSPAYLCTAGTGYDGPSGLGSPRGIMPF